jgi:hypothetical protein
MMPRAPLRPHPSRAMEARRARLDRALAAMEFATVALMVLLGSVIWIFVAVEVGYR